MRSSRSPLQRGLIAERHVRVLVGDFQQGFADSSPISLSELGKLADDFCCTHAGNLVRTRESVIHQTQPR